MFYIALHATSVHCVGVCGLVINNMLTLLD